MESATGVADPAEEVNRERLQSTAATAGLLVDLGIGFMASGYELRLASNSFHLGTDVTFDSR